MIIISLSLYIYIYIIKHVLHLLHSENRFFIFLSSVYIGWRVAAKPLLVQLVRSLDLHRKPPPPPPDDTFEKLEEERAKKFGYHKEKLAAERKRKAQEMLEVCSLQWLASLSLSIHTHTHTSLVVFTTMVYH